MIEEKGEIVKIELTLRVLFTKPAILAVFRLFFNHFPAILAVILSSFSIF